MGGKPVMNITVYLGANAGNDPALRDAVRALGRWIGESGNALVYGGSKNGLMGALAESVLAAGGRATGVEPQVFVDQGFLYDELTELIVTRDFPERKAKMLELGDAFIAFPGGTGTLEEIAEVMSRVALGQLDAPCILYNLNGYYDGLRTQLAHMIELGLSSEMPTLARMDVSAANTAESRANTNHIPIPPFPTRVTRAAPPPAGGKKVQSFSRATCA